VRPESHGAQAVVAPSDDAPIATVVVPAYNGAKTIAATLESVLNQREARLRLVVVDDGSTDDTVEVVRRYADDGRLTLIEQENRGVAGARNRGIEQARTPYVSFLDNDDMWMPTYLGSVITALENDPEAGLAYADGWELDDPSGRYARAPLSSRAAPPDPIPRDAEQLLYELARNNFVWGSVTVRRRALEEVGGFNPAIAGVDDYEMWLRIVAAGWLIARPPGRLIVQRYRPDSASRDYTMMFTGIRDTCALIAENAELPDRVREAAHSRLDELNRTIDYESAAGPPGALRTARRSAGAIKRRISDRWRLHDETPQEIVKAFGDKS
jgi:glycosyltransferase involved in cell wall biosynthesis